MAVASAGPYESLHLAQTDNHASTPPLSFFTGRMPFLPPDQQCQSTEGTDRLHNVLDMQKNIKTTVIVKVLDDATPMYVAVRNMLLKAHSLNISASKPSSSTWMLHVIKNKVQTSRYKRLCGMVKLLWKIKAICNGFKAWFT